MNYYDNLTAKDIAIGAGNTTPWIFYIKNTSGNPVNVSGNDYVFKVDTVENPVDIETEVFELGGIVLDATGGTIQFGLTQNQSNQAGEYYYRLQAIDQFFRKSTLATGKFKISSQVLGVSGLEWKPDAVSGDLGEVFSENGTSGLAYFAGGPVYKDETSGISLIFGHAEEGYWDYSDTYDGRKIGGWLGSIRLKVSYDDGKTLYDAGKIITSQEPPSSVYAATGPLFGTDTIRNVAFCYKKDDYLYVYYTTDRIGTGPNDLAALCVARAPYNDVMTSAADKNVSPWYKYYNGSFSQPALGGSATDLIQSYTLAQLNHITGFYSTELDCIVILYQSTGRVLDNNLYIINTGEEQDHIYAIYSKDGISFSYPQKLKSIDAGMRYFSVISPNMHLGLGGRNLTAYSTSGYWPYVNNIGVTRFGISSLSIPVATSPYSIGTYTTPFKLNQTIDRGQLHPIIATMHYIKEHAKLLEASAYYYSNTSGYVTDNRWKNVLQSYANNSTELSGNFPDSFDDYINFEFGRDMHKLYYEYTHNFARHRTTPTILNFDGPLITAHTYGSIIYNSDFEAQGSAALTYSNIITSSLESVNSLNAGRGVFSSSGTASGTYLASSILNYGSSIGEYRNSAILSHIELCQTSGASTDNEFTIIDIFGKTKAATRRNKLLGDNVLIRQKAVDGFGRIIFDISKYPLPAAYFDKQYNFLSPEHEFEVSLKAVIGDANGIHIGGGAVGVWIHTKPEGGKVWTFTKDKLWVQHEAEGITKDDVIGKYSHNFFLPLVDRQLNSPTFVSASNRFVCARALDPTNPNRVNDLISTYQENEFTDIKIKFNTMNRACNRDVINVPKDYFEQIASRVHRLNQNYVIELFTLPQQNDKFTLFYGLNMVDLTLNKLSKPIAAKTGCEYLRVDLPPQHLLNIIKYFNLLAGDYDNTYVNNLTGYASRVSTITSSFMEASGGSRITYVEDPNWGANSPNTNTLRDQITIIN